MPSVFDKRFRKAGFPLLQRDFGECVLYKFRDGGSRAIKAIIEREPPSVYDASGNVVSLSFVIRVPNCSDNGVLASEVDTGGDSVELVKEIGDTLTKEVSVLVLMSQSSGVVTLGLR